VKAVRFDEYGDVDVLKDDSQLILHRL